MSLRVAIVGAGPKGLYALERLLDHVPPGVPLTVDVFEPHPHPGAGPVYDPAQPDYLRMNLAAGRLDLWWPGSRAVAPAEQRSFAEWRGAQDTDPYPPRALVGRYLAEGYALLCRHAPPDVTITTRRERVRRVRATACGWDVAGASYDELVLATGHAPPAGPAVFPVERWLGPDRIPPGATVAVRGFALTFLDAALALTEGRGGRFEPAGHPHRLRYVPSPGDVRVVVPFSRSGRPMLAKPGPAPGLESLMAAGRERIAAMPAGSDLEPIVADVAAAALAAAGGAPDAGEPASAAAELARSLDVATGVCPPGPAWALGQTWRDLYPAIVARLGGDGLPAGLWPAFRRLAARMERIAFGPPPVNAAKLLALVDAGVVDLAHVRGGPAQADRFVDAVLPAPGVDGRDPLVSGLIADGHARVRPGCRGLDVGADASCIGRGGSPTHGLAAVGRPTEDSVIGNDTLTRAMHPQPDRWARRVAARAADRAVVAA